jgi:hypothetical protein
MVALAQPSLPPNYTKKRPIGSITRNAAVVLGAVEAAWVVAKWNAFQGGDEDCPFNVIMEVKTPSGVRAWVVDRNGEASLPMLMLPEDY